MQHAMSHGLHQTSECHSVCTCCSLQESELRIEVTPEHAISVMVSLLHDVAPGSTH